jgi:aryl-alcohol dehydrogenase-like predicted oxidoreductase
MDRYKKSLAVEAVDEYAKVAKAHLLTPTQLSLMWCYSRPWVRDIGIYRLLRMV